LKRDKLVTILNTNLNMIEKLINIILNTRGNISTSLSSIDKNAKIVRSNVMIGVRTMVASLMRVNL